MESGHETDGAGERRSAGEGGEREREECKDARGGGGGGGGGARWRAGGGFDEDRASRERVVIHRRRKERPRERGTVTREERRTCRYEMERRGGTSARGDRESTGTGRTSERASERDRGEKGGRRGGGGGQGVKKREGTRGKRGETISRGSERERRRG